MSLKITTFSAQEHPLRCSLAKPLPVAKAQAKSKNSMSSSLIPTGTTAPQACFDIFDHMSCLDWEVLLYDANKPGVIRCHS